MRHRKTRRRLCRMVLGLTLMPAARLRAVEMSPIYGVQVLGGQYYFSGQKGTLAGNVNAIVAPAAKFNDNWSVLPSLNSAYNGSQQTIDLIGSSTLFQEQWDNRASVTTVYTPNGSNWRIKPSTSFKYEMLKETKGENWGGDLFDYYKWDGSLEAEYVFQDPYSVRFGVDYYEMYFPNYSSLSAQAALSVGGQSIARELDQNGALNTHNIAAYTALEAPILPWLIGSGSVMETYQWYPNQHLVDNTDSLQSTLRGDIISNASLGVKVPYQFSSKVRVIGGLDGIFTYDASNQNSFDATQTQFLRYYYNYAQLQLTPSAKVMYGDPKTPIVFSQAFSWYGRRYPYRLTQNATGAYQGSTTHTNNYMSSTSLSYPMAQHFNLMFNFQYGQATSNMHFEQFFQYNYTVTNYFFGFSYDY